jgi:hypothetical protein
MRDVPFWRAYTVPAHARGFTTSTFEVSIHPLLTCFKVDKLRLDLLNGPLWEEYHESRRCSRDTCPEPYITN